MKLFIKYYMRIVIVFIWMLPLNLFAAPSLLNIQVSILPQKYFVERIGKDRVKVDVLVKPGKSPVTYSPSPDQMRKLTTSDVYFRIGVPFENGILDKIKSTAGIKIVDTRKGIVLRSIAKHTHDGHNQSESIGKDPHIWMSPLIVKIQAHTIFETLSNIDPAGMNEYKKNYEQFIEDLGKLDHHLKILLKNLEGEDLLVFHPAFGYFTDAYGLKQVAIETMGKSPKGKTLSNIIKLAKKQKIRVIFAQPQFDNNTAKKIASAINGVVILIDPLAYDYMVNMENIAQAIAGVLKK